MPRDTNQAKAVVEMDAATARIVAHVLLETLSSLSDKDRANCVRLLHDLHSHLNVKALEDTTSPRFFFSRRERFSTIPS